MPILSHILNNLMRMVRRNMLTFIHFVEDAQIDKLSHLMRMEVRNMLSLSFLKRLLGGKNMLTLSH
jgi:hypothetical protein